MAGILDWLLNDPSGSAGGGFLSSLLGANSPTASTMTPTTPAAPVGSGGILGGSGAPYPFRPRTGLLGDSPFADAVRGGLSGMGAANGYSGFGSQLAAGAQGAVKSGRERQMYNLQNQLYGQQFQKGSQDLAAGNMDLAQKVSTFNIWQHAIDPNAPQVTVSDLQNDPGKLAQIMSWSPGDPTGTQAPATSAPSGQPSQGAGMAPVYGGGGNVNPQVTQAYGGSSAQPPAAQPQGPQGAPQMAPQASANPLDNLNSGFAALHMGMTPQQWANLGMRMRNQGMVSEAAKYDPTLIYQSEHAKALASPQNMRSGSVLFDPLTNQPIYQAPMSQPGVDANGAPTVKYVTPGMPNGNPGGAATNAGGVGGQPDVTGLAPGVDKQYKDAVDRDTQLRDFAAGSSDRQNILQNLSHLANDTQFGPGRPTQYKWQAIGSAIPVLGGMFGTDDTKNLDIFNKFVSQLGMQYQKALGGKGTDAQLNVALQGIPSADKMSAAIKEIVPWMQSQEAAVQAQANARDAWANKSPKGMIEFEHSWRQNYDPRQFQFLQMDAGRRAAFLQGLSAKDRAEFVRKGKALEQMGAFQ